MIPYNTEAQKVIDDSYIGKGTDRFYIRPFFVGQGGDDIKGFSVIGEEDGWKNWQKVGIYSSTYGVLVEPSRHIRARDMDFGRNCTLEIDDGGTIDDYKEAERRALDDPYFKQNTLLEQSRVLDYLYKQCKSRHVVPHVAYGEIQAFLDARLANGARLTPATYEELFTFIKERRDQSKAYNMTSTEDQIMSTRVGKLL